jgi:hypothetical protein
MREGNHTLHEDRPVGRQRRHSLSDPTSLAGQGSLRRENSQDVAPEPHSKSSRHRPHHQSRHNGRRNGANRQGDQYTESEDLHRSHNENHPSNPMGHGCTPQVSLSGYNSNQLTVYMHALQLENTKLRNEADDFKYQTESLIRERDRLQGDLAKLQSKQIAAIDRYQPELDENLKLNFGFIRKPVSKLSRFIAFNMTSKIPSEELLAKLKKYSWMGGSSSKSALIDLESKDNRRRIWTSVIWRFLEDELFCRPFLCFGGQWAETLDHLYFTLYPNASEYLNKATL